MKIAVIHTASSVGAWRWISGVFGVIKKYYPDTEITIFYEINDACPNGVIDTFSSLGLKLKPQKITRSKFVYKDKKLFKIKFLDNYYNKLRKLKYRKSFLKSNSFYNLVNDVNKYDLAFFSWPFNCESIKFDIPSFFIPHDFIFTHFFGLHVGNVYSHKWYVETKQMLQKYIDAGAEPFASSQFIADEFRRTFSAYKKDVHVVQLSRLNELISVNKDECKKTLEKFEINNEYILLATNNMHHKNMEEALTAYYYVKQKYPKIKMIIIGYGTEGIYVQANSPYYCDHIDENEPYDIKSLGLVQDSELIALMSEAKLLLNVSLCEAACGSGLDAWQLGVPTAISDIPCYKEQVEKLGVKTEFFNPKNSEDIASAMLRILDNPQKAKENAEISKNALETNWTQKDVADAYMKVFEDAVKERKNK